MTENERYCVRAGYWHNYTGIGRCEDENLTTNEVCDLINEQHETIKEVHDLLVEEVDLFSDKATEHDINAYVELKEFDNKDAYYMATATKKAIKMLRELI